MLYGKEKNTRNQSTISSNIFWVTLQNWPTLESWFQNEFVIGINTWSMNLKINNSCFPLFFKYLWDVTIGTMLSTENAKINMLQCPFAVSSKFNGWDRIAIKIFEFSLPTIPQMKMACYTDPRYIFFKLVISLV